MLKIYSIPQCSYCSKLKDLLSKSNIDFIDVNIELSENKDEFEKLNKIANSDSVPIILCDKKILIPEVSFKSIDEAFVLIKNFLNIK